jgi:hypothetical protein
MPSDWWRVDHVYLWSRRLRAVPDKVTVWECSSVAIFGDEERQRISAALNSKGINRPCPACGKWDIAIVDGYVKHRLYSSSDLDANVGGDQEQGIACIAIACSHCGLLSHHTVSGLGL